MPKTKLRVGIMGWEPDKKSQEAEARVVELLRMHYRATEAMRSRDASHDVCFTLPYGTKRLCEIKTDFLASQTKNLYFETRNTQHGCPSGLTLTRADVWGHYVPHLKKLWLFDPKALLWYLRAHRDNPMLGIVLSRPNSGDHNSQGYIVPIKTAQKWSWPSVLEVDTP